MLAQSKSPESRRGRISVGTDVMSVTEVSRSLERFGERYVRRIFTPREADYCCRAVGRGAAERFAARFAAKEAVLKALRLSDQSIDWRSIEVVRHPSGWCDVGLHGEVAALAARDGIDMLALSMSHEADCAMAVAMAQFTDRATNGELEHEV
jgi:holo-[acyl-carrier protein] synthase